MLIFPFIKLIHICIEKYIREKITHNLTIQGTTLWFVSFHSPSLSSSPSLSHRYTHTYTHARTYTLKCTHYFFVFLNNVAIQTILFITTFLVNCVYSMYRILSTCGSRPGVILFLPSRHPDTLGDIYVLKRF